MTQAESRSVYGYKHKCIDVSLAAQGISSTSSQGSVASPYVGLWSTLQSQTHVLTSRWPSYSIGKRLVAHKIFLPLLFQCVHLVCLLYKGSTAKKGNWWPLSPCSLHNLHKTFWHRELWPSGRMLTDQCQHYLNNLNVEATQNGVLMVKVAIYLVQAEIAVPLWGEMVTVRTISYERVKANDPTMPTMGYGETRILFLWIIWENSDMNSFRLNSFLQEILKTVLLSRVKLEETEQHSDLGEMAWKLTLPGRTPSHKQHCFFLEKVWWPSESPSVLFS